MKFFDPITKRPITQGAVPVPAHVMAGSTEAIQMGITNDDDTWTMTDLKFEANYPVKSYSFEPAEIPPGRHSILTITISGDDLAALPNDHPAPENRITYSPYRVLGG